MKKMCIVLMVIVLLFSVVGCNTDSSQDQTAAETIKIGWFGPLSGPAAEVGVNGLRAAELAVEQINKDGGIDGSTIELFSYDDEGVPETSTKVISRLIEEDEVVGIIGSHLSSSILTVSDRTEEAKVVMVGTGTSSIWANVGLKYTFRGTANSVLFAKQAFDAMLKMGATKVATINGDTEYAQTVTEDIASYVNEHSDMEVVASQSWTAGDPDYSGQLIKIVSANPDALFVVGGGEDVGKVVGQARKQGYDGYIYGVEPFADTNAMKMAGKAFNDVIFGAAYFVPESADAALNTIEKDFLTAYEQKYGELPTAEVAYRAYDASMILFGAIQNAEDISGDSIRDAVHELDYTGIGGTFNFSPETDVEGLDSTNVYIYTEDKHQDFYEWYEKRK